MKNTIVLMLILTVIITGCTPENAQKPTQNIQENAGMSSINTANVQKIEIYHFHPTNQCSSCLAVGNYAEETVNTYYSEELKSGKIVFAHINAQLPENSELVTKYGVTGSSLWIGIYDGNGFHAEQNTNVWYKIGNKAEYMSYLKGVIDKRLAGDYS